MISIFQYFNIDQNNCDYDFFHNQAALLHAQHFPCRCVRKADGNVSYICLVLVQQIAVFLTERLGLNCHVGGRSGYEVILWIGVR